MATQIHSTKSIRNKNGMGVVSQLLRLATTGTLIYIAWLSFSEDKVTRSLAFSIGGALYFFLIHKPVWLFSDFIRDLLMPTRFVVRNSRDAFNEIFFWHLGPQLIGCVLSGWLIFITADIVGQKSSSHQNEKHSERTDASEKIQINQDNKLPLVTTEFPRERIVVTPKNKEAEPKSYEMDTKKNITALSPEEIEEMEKKVQYSGDDEIVRERLGLPPKRKEPEKLKTCVLNNCFE